MSTLLTVPEVAKRLAVSSATVRRLIAAHKLPVVRLGGESGRSVRVDELALAGRIHAWTDGDQNKNPGG